MMKIKNAVYAQNGKSITCDVEHPDLGWIPFTARNDGADNFEKEVWKALQSITIAEPTPISRVEQRKIAFASIDQVHSKFLRELTGNASVEERDTWKIKEEAARALIANEATPGQQAMIENEALGDGRDARILAQTIVAKADAFSKLIGLAAGLKAKAKAAIVTASDDTVPIEQLSSSIDHVLAALSDEAAIMAQAWQKSA